MQGVERINKLNIGHGCCYVCELHINLIDFLKLLRVQQKVKIITCFSLQQLFTSLVSQKEQYATYFNGNLVTKNYANVPA